MMASARPLYSLFWLYSNVMGHVLCGECKLQSDASASMLQVRTMKALEKVEMQVAEVQQADLTAQAMSNATVRAMLFERRINMSGTQILQIEPWMKLTGAAVKQHCPDRANSLELHWDSKHGDKCRKTKNGDDVPSTWRCPRGCVEVQLDDDELTDFKCGDPVTRTACRVTDPTNPVDRRRRSTWGQDQVEGSPCFADRPDLIDFTDDDSSNYEKGNYCQTAGGLEMTYFLPLDCNWYRDSRPYTRIRRDNSKTGLQLCRIGHYVGASTDSTEPAMGQWVLIASGTQGVAAEMETGVMTEEGKEVTEETATTVGIAISAMVGVEGMGMKAEMTVEASSEVTESIAETVSDTIGQHAIHAVKVACLDNSTALEQIWQWQVVYGSVVVKSPHFRCHPSFDGHSEKPQCPPFLCGSPSENPLCKAPTEGDATTCHTRCGEHGCTGSAHIR